MSVRKNTLINLAGAIIPMIVMLVILIRHALSKNPFALSLSKCEWILVLRQAQHERQSSPLRTGSIVPLYLKVLGDVRHSLAVISKVASRLIYQSTNRLSDGLKIAMEWNAQHLTKSAIQL